MRARVIPVLLLKGDLLYKSVQFKKMEYVGDPINTVKLFNDKEVDELVLLDIDASKKNIEPNYALLKEIVSEAFMPIAYGGGIKTIKQAEQIFGCGVEKIIINAAIFENPSLLFEISSHYGAQSVSLSINVKRGRLNRKNFIYDHRSHNCLKMSVEEYISKIEMHTIGEILLTSVDRDGMRNGYDLELAAKISAFISVPLVISGGAAKFKDFESAASIGLSGVAASGYFIYQYSSGSNKAVLVNYPSYEELQQLKSF